MKGEVFVLRLGMYLTKDKRDNGDIMLGSVEKVERQYHPLVGSDENGAQEVNVDEAVEIVKPYACVVKEVNLYA